jgi:hypothetical protein
MDQGLASEFIALVERHLSTEGERHAILQKCCTGLLPRLDLTQPAHVFAANAWALLNAYGELKPGKPAVVAFLEELRNNVGVDQIRIIDDLILAITDTHMATIAPPPTTDDSVEVWKLKTLYDLGKGFASLTERVSLACDAVEKIDTLTEAVDRIDEQTRINRRGMIFNRVFFFTIITADVLVLILVLASTGILA